MDILDFRIKPLRDYLPDDVYREVCRRALRRKFNDGDSLHIRGDPSPRLCIVAQGAVRIGRIRPDGSFNLVSVLGVGGHFGDVGLQRAANTHDGYALGRCELFVVEAPMLEEMLSNNSGFALGLWRCNTERLYTILELYDDVRTLDIITRLAKIIYIHAGQGKIEDGVACRQRDLADLLGVSQVSVATSLKTLEKYELIERRYRCVIIPNLSRLKDWLQNNNAI